MEPTQVVEQNNEKRTPLFVPKNWMPGPTFAWACISLGLFVGFNLFLVPRFEEIYVSLGAQLPASTQILVTISRIMLHNPLPALILICATLFAALWLDRERRANRDKNLWRWLVILLYLGLLFVVTLATIAVYLPLFKIGSVVK